MTHHPIPLIIHHNIDVTLCLRSPANCMFIQKFRWFQPQRVSNTERVSISWRQNANKSAKISTELPMLQSVRGHHRGTASQTDRQTDRKTELVIPLQKYQQWKQLSAYSTYPTIVVFLLLVIWTSYSRSFSEYYLSTWNKSAVNQRLQLFVQSLPIFDLAWRNFFPHISLKINGYLNSAAKSTSHWNDNKVFGLITSWDTT